MCNSVVHCDSIPDKGTFDSFQTICNLFLSLLHLYIWTVLSLSIYATKHCTYQSTLEFKNQFYFSFCGLYLTFLSNANIKHKTAYMIIFHSNPKPVIKG